MSTDAVSAPDRQLAKTYTTFEQSLVGIYGPPDIRQLPNGTWSHWLRLEPARPMSHLSVSFEPTRKGSTSSTGSGSKPTPHSPDGVTQPSKPIPYSIDTASEPYRKKTFHLPRGSPCTPSHSRPSTPQIPQSQDPERQPLIAPTELNRRKTAYPIVFGVMAVVILGFLVGVGGWRLSHGEGGDRWPGGPH